MLRSLFIKNFVLIDKHEIEFSKSLNVITGETGAGKSIIVNAIKFLLGDKADKNYIRKGESELKVQGDFNISGLKEVISYLKQKNIDLDDNNLLVERIYNEDGRSINKLNGEKVTLSNYKEVVKLLIDICGQHDNVSLLDVSNHIKIIDLFCERENQSFLKLKNDYQALYKQYIEVVKKIKEYTAIEKPEKKIQNLKKDIKELENANIKKGELKELEHLNEIYEYASDITGSLSAASEELCGDPDDSSRVNAEWFVSEACSRLHGYKIKEINDFSERVESLLIELRDINDSMLNYLDKYEFDEDKAIYVHNRCELLYSLETKYNKSADELIPYLEELKNELNTYLDLDYILQTLYKEKVELLAKINEVLLNIRTIRIKVANNLSKRIIEELKSLNMPSIKFVVEFNDFPNIEQIEKKISIAGIDQIIFKISTNLGQDVKPLNKIASGGEMSRIMLAIKNALYEVDNIPTVIFDEIDSGISGVTANALGDKLYILSKNQQIILITHLAQIAALADKHLLIEKYEKDNLTFSKVSELNDDEKITEISRLISGKANSDISKKQAIELIKRKGELNEL